jgi:two-component system, OmpR family, alkaline phosphatase synthesis response regulator PhoP
MAETRKTVLVVEDEPDLAGLICGHLEREGYHCRKQFDGVAALAEAQRDLPDLIVLDRMIPRLSGDEVIRRLKRDPRTSGVPVLMLTAKVEETDELIGLALGADDYLRKPVSMKVLSARVSAILRRGETAGQAETLSGGPVVVDRSRHEVTVEGMPVSVTATEFRLLGALMGAKGRVLDRQKLLDTVLGSGVAATHRTIDVHIAALRRKLGIASGWIQTIRGVGYTFREPHEKYSQA